MSADRRSKRPARLGPGAPKLDLRGHLVVIVIGAGAVLGYGRMLQFLLDQMQKTTDRFFLDYGLPKGRWDWLWKLPGELILSHGFLLLLVPAGLALAHVLVIWHQRTYTYQIQWWLGEIGRRVYGAYDVEWPFIAQVTRYRPLPWGMDWRKPHRQRVYRLRARNLGLPGPRVEFEIRVPTKEGEPMEVWERIRGTSGLRPVPLLPDATPPHISSPASSARRQRRSRA